MKPILIFALSLILGGISAQTIPDIPMVYVEGGTFTMGCTSEQNDCWDDEKITRRVTLSSYYIGKYEVTQAQWFAVMGDNPSHFSGCDQCPVESVSWTDARAFCRRLSKMTGKNYRLPTEAEWEFAARGGNQSNGFIYSGSNHINAVAVYLDNSNYQIAPVGSKAPNELGIYDMSGNVGEWCQDWYDAYPNQAQTNPTGPATGVYRVLRGGGWGCYAFYCRVSDRGGYEPDNRNNSLGFRLVLAP